MDNSYPVDQFFNFGSCPPSELFCYVGDWSDEDRIANFFNLVKPGDVLDCEVSQILVNKYVLKVLIKHGSPRLLCDLNITVTLQGKNMDESKAEKPLKVNDLVRVAVINQNTQELSCNKKIMLGKINAKDLPEYLRKPPKHCLTLVDYLNSHPELSSTSSTNLMFTSLGLDIKKQKSFHPSINSCYEMNEPTGQALLKEAENKDLENSINLVITELENENPDKALEAINEALEIKPCSEFYELRGKIYSELEKPRLSKKALLDYERSYALDPNNSTVSKLLSSALSTAAIKFCKSKVYPKAVFAAERAITLDKCNQNASVVLSYAKKKSYQQLDDIAEPDFETITID